jgi:hypothetical protein
VSGSEYGHGGIPDIVALTPIQSPPRPQIILVGELKTSWITQHDILLKVEMRDEDEGAVMQSIDQESRYLQGLQCEFGFLDVYEESIHSRQFPNNAEIGGWNSPQ